MTLLELAGVFATDAVLKAVEKGIRAKGELTLAGL